MHTFEHTVEIEAPIEYVYQFNSDPMNWPEITPGLSAMEIVETTDSGYRMEATYKMLGMSMKGDMEMTIVEEGKHIKASFHSDAMSGELNYHFTEIADGTKVIQRGHMEFGDSVLDRIMEPVAKRYNIRQFKTSLENNRDLLEAEYVAESTATTA